jgi:hypothetical protein
MGVILPNSAAISYSGGRETSSISPLGTVAA